MFLTMRGRRVVIAGGGEPAAQKARLMLKTEARLTLLAPALDPELAGLVASGRAEHDPGRVAPASFADAALVFVATGCPGLDAALHALAKEAGAVVNVVDRPELCDATTPSIVDRDPVVVAIGTEGAAPVLARRIKTEIEARLDPRLGSYAALAGRLRDAVAARVPRARRRAFWAWAFSGEPWAAHRRGAEREAAAALKAAVAAGGPPDEVGGSIALVGAGPGAADLLTLRAVERLQEADVIFFDRLVDPGALELARRDAERVCVGKAVGACEWPQGRIDAVVVAEARRGRRVVRLKSGDPSVFGRACEELAAAREAGVPVEIVPGVTAASAAAAALGRPLSERGETDRIVLATGTCRPGDPDPDWAALATPGATVALYMAVHRAATIARDLGRVLPHDSPVEVVADASLPSQRVLACALGELSRTLQEHEVRSPAILIVRNPKAAMASRSSMAETAIPA
jgi:uroporphyrin-III C-methyltransferase/precorrin-2 dehydrogenase/sirohydrochlorin ferrochelatase